MARSCDVQKSGEGRHERGETGKVDLRPLVPPTLGKIAVKVINRYGDEDVEGVWGKLILDPAAFKKAAREGSKAGKQEKLNLR